MAAPGTPVALATTPSKSLVVAQPSSLGPTMMKAVLTMENSTTTSSWMR